jgi:hypothetical protein
MALRWFEMNVSVATDRQLQLLEVRLTLFLDLLLQKGVGRARQGPVELLDVGVARISDNRVVASRLLKLVEYVVVDHHHGLVVDGEGGAEVGQHVEELLHHVDLGVRAWPCRPPPVAGVVVVPLHLNLAVVDDERKRLDDLLHVGVARLQLLDRETVVGHERLHDSVVSCVP